LRIPEHMPSPVERRIGLVLRVHLCESMHL
jgi:hypothetical protein